MYILVQYFALTMNLLFSGHMSLFWPCVQAFGTFWWQKNSIHLTFALCFFFIYIYFRAPVLEYGGTRGYLQIH